MKHLETNKRLTESVLWELQNLAYSQFGPEAWANKGVPFYLTSNPLIAKQFTPVLVGYITDCMRKAGPNSIDVSKPFYIFDLGAGSGKLGFLILKYLIPLVRDLISPDLKICYVMTDIIESNIDFCKNHSLLKPYIESGNLDFALYHHTHNTPLQLICSGLTLDTVDNPIALICTYYFDTVPQDLFRANKGKLEEGRVTISIPDEFQNAESNNLSPEMIMNLEISYKYEPISNSATYYSEQPAYNRLLEEYRTLFDVVPFLFPFGGLESIRYFSNLSNHRLLMLAGDQGVSTEKQVKEWGEPKIALHATFSMPVSYHLLAKYFHNQRGVGFLTSHPNPKYVLMSGILGGSSKDFPSAKTAFQEIDSLEPWEYLELTDISVLALAELSLEHVLLYIKLGNWDPINFNHYFSEILKKLKNASERDKEFLQFAIYRVWDNFYPINPDEWGFIMNLGVLFFEMKKYEEALFFFKQSFVLSPNNAILLKNIKACYHLLGI